jgi:hypothetical protein
VQAIDKHRHPLRTCSMPLSPAAGIHCKFYSFSRIAAAGSAARPPPSHLLARLLTVNVAQEVVHAATVQRPRDTACDACVPAPLRRQQLGGHASAAQLLVVSLHTQQAAAW